ncbi:MAG: fumarylacetoacetate hydrolase [Hyphomicrobiales bacterium]|nr:MAG: fumarylacetoacetate hydrolase [Hyphomicrobiales bacterium]
MSSFVFEPLPTPSLPVEGMDERFPIRRIFCVGRNYAAHAREMGHDPDREDPFFFTKPADAIVSDGADIPYPSETNSLHHEIELVVAIGKDGSNIEVDNANEHVFGYGVGVDLTRRDLQAEAKKKSRPWDLSKGFDYSAPCTALVKREPADLEGKRIWLTVNGDSRQDASLNELIWSVEEVIAYLSRFVELKQGDLIYTGTPAGVDAAEKGDDVKGGIDGIGEISFKLI